MLQAGAFGNPGSHYQWEYLKNLKNVLKHLFNTEKKLFLMSMSQVRSMIEGSPEFGQDGKF